MCWRCDKEDRPNVEHHGELKTIDDFVVGQANSATGWEIIEKIHVL